MALTLTDQQTAASIVALAGGVGGARLVEGLQQLVGSRLTVIGNVADDTELWGLHISPDLDTVMYTLAGIANEETGWGIAGDTWQSFEMLAHYGAEPWFRLGDRDLATHLLRTALLRSGATLTEVTTRLARALGVQAHLLPVTNAPLRTIVLTDEGELAFQEYFVHRRWQPRLLGLRVEGADQAGLTPAALAALDAAATVVLCPSNPFVSIAPLLAVEPLPARLRVLKAAGVPVVAVSPIVGGQALKGPAAKMFAELGEEPTALAVARRYTDFLSHFLLDVRDADQIDAVRALGLVVGAADTIMLDREGRRRVAAAALALARG
ncbi:MAG TPA: 2-phospho-L-lactate transferase, partial [Chloroflexi bacterium]|nr:2-phospho-L-lactate transferase [Chloroflexota bacterium]